MRRSEPLGGMGKCAQASIEAQCRAANIDTLWLTVNKFNPAVLANQRLGFTKAADTVTDAGGGYVMDEYQLERKFV